MTRRALVVGVPSTTFRPDDFVALPGAAKDAARVADYLQGVGFDEVIMPTGDGLRSSALQTALTSLVTRTEAGDLGVFYFSGHGWQFPDIGGDEKDADPADSQDEGIVVGDATIRDDWFGVKLWPLAKPGAAFAAIVDACHAETAVTYLQLFQTATAVDPPARPNVNLAVGPERTWSRIVLAACHDDENAFADPGDGEGVATSAMLGLLKDEPTLTYEQLWGKVAARCAAYGHNRKDHPVADYRGPNRLLLDSPAFTLPAG